MNRRRKASGGSVAQARAAVYERSNGVCELCGASRGSNWHHRKARSQLGLWTPANGLHLCGSGTTGCHGWVESHPAFSYENGWRLHTIDEPEAVPVWLSVPMPAPWLLDDQGDLAPAWHLFGPRAVPSAAPEWATRFGLSL